METLQEFHSFFRPGIFQAELPDPRNFIDSTATY